MSLDPATKVSMRFFFYSILIIMLSIDRSSSLLLSTIVLPNQWSLSSSSSRLNEWYDILQWSYPQRLQSWNQRLQFSSKHRLYFGLYHCCCLPTFCQIDGHRHVRWVVWMMDTIYCNEVILDDDKVGAKGPKRRDIQAKWNKRKDLKVSK